MVRSGVGDTVGMGERSASEARAAGVHLPWVLAPPRVRAWAGSLGRVLGARDASGGFSPGCCAVLELAGGRSVFVKAVGTELNEQSPDIHRQEGRIAAALPRLAQLPRLVDTYDDGDWVALAFEAVEGAMPRHPWEDGELRAVLENLARVHEALTPCPLDDAPVASERERRLLDGWHTLAGMGRPPAGLDGWFVRHLDRLCELEERAWDAVAGETLIHGDLRADNMLIDGTTTVFVDWPHASRGTPLRDLIGWAPSVALEGGPDPETLLARYRPAAGGGGPRGGHGARGRPGRVLRPARPAAVARRAPDAARVPGRAGPCDGGLAAAAHRVALSTAPGRTFQQ